jgi:hypothetical protein
MEMREKSVVGEEKEAYATKQNNLITVPKWWHTQDLSRS